MKKVIYNTICFSEVMGRKRAFLIQNVFPVTQKYIENCYINKATGSEVRIIEADEMLINKNAREVLKLAFRGIPVLFADVVPIYKSLVQQLELDRQAALKQVNLQTGIQPTPRPCSLTERLEAAKRICSERNAAAPDAPPWDKGRSR